MLKTKMAKFIFKIIGIFLLIILCLGSFNIGNLNDNSNYQFLTIDEENIRYHQQGKGKDIILIHGTPGSIEDWKIIVDSLSLKYRVTTFDRLGHGFSSSKNYSYTLKDNAVLVEKLMPKLHIENPLIIGHSYGGSIAAWLATNSKIKNAAYIIIDSPLYEYKPNRLYKLIATPILGKGLATISSYTVSKNYIKKALSSLLENLTKEQTKTLITERQIIWSQPKVIYSKSKESVNYSNDLDKISKKYKTITAKVNLITGQNPRATFKKDCERFHKEVQNSKLFVLENTRHYIPIENPKAVVTIVENMINDTIFKKNDYLEKRHFK